MQLVPSRLLEHRNLCTACSLDCSLQPCDSEPHKDMVPFLLIAPYLMLLLFAFTGILNLQKT